MQQYVGFSPNPADPNCFLLMTRQDGHFSVRHMERPLSMCAIGSKEGQRMALRHTAAIPAGLWGFQAAGLRLIATWP